MIRIYGSPREIIPLEAHAINSVHARTGIATPNVFLLTRQMPDFTRGGEGGCFYSLNQVTWGLTPLRAVIAASVFVHEADDVNPPNLKAVKSCLYPPPVHHHHHPRSPLCLRALTSDSRFKPRLYQRKRQRITDAWQSST